MATIMTIDDSPTIRRLIHVTASMAGYTVIEAENGEDALTKLKEQEEKINLFIVDVHMPIMDGITFVKRLRQISQYNKTPVIMLTTESQKTKKQEGKSAGATGWMLKPFKQDVLLKVLQRMI